MFVLVWAKNGSNQLQTDFSFFWVTYSSLGPSSSELWWEKYTGDQQEARDISVLWEHF